MARIVATGVVLAIVVLEIQLTLGFRLADTPLFRYPWPTVGLIVAAGEADCTVHARPFLLDPRWAWNAARALGVEPPSLPLPAARASTILTFKPQPALVRAAD